MKWKKTNQDTFYLSKKISKFNMFLNEDDIKFLRKQAFNSKENKARLCLHKSPKENLHFMIIFHKKNHLVNIHKHLKTDESYFLLDGKMRVNFFDLKGNIINNVLLSSSRDTLPFFINVPKNTYHNQIFYKDTVFFEIKNGPFIKKNDLFLNNYQK